MTADLFRQLADRELSSVALTERCLARIEAHDAQIGAFLHVDRPRALQQAASIDERRAKGEALGPLAGIPVAIKDVICEAGQPATCASRMRIAWTIGAAAARRSISVLYGAIRLSGPSFIT